MKKAAAKIGPMLASLPFGSHYQGAFIPGPSIGDSQTDYRTRAVIAAIGLTANTPYEAVYWMYTVDSGAQPLTGVPALFRSTAAMAQGAESQLASWNDGPTKRRDQFKDGQNSWSQYPADSPPPMS
jgi:hypothetical protein